MLAAAEQARDSAELRRRNCPNRNNLSRRFSNLKHLNNSVRSNKSLNLKRNQSDPNFS